jgi:hypothetical protein
MTHQQVADTLGISRTMAARYIKTRSCPTTTPEEVLRWYHSNIRMKADRRRPAAPAVALVGPAPNSRILDLIEDHGSALELDGDILALPAEIAHQPDFLPTIQNNQAVRRCVRALYDKWFGARV